ncbi:MAG: helix-turn-helix domain-containing protein [Bacillota bacterium]|jgi:AraC family transcriptional regulator
MKGWIRIPDEKAPELKPGPQFSLATLEIHSSSHLTIIVPKARIDLPRARHYHNSYEFLLPLETMDNCYVGNQIVSIPVHNIMPFNPNQIHGASEPGSVRFLSIMLTRTLIQNLAHALGFRSDVEFTNECVAEVPRFRSLVNTFLSESKGQQICYEAILDSLAVEITVFLMRHLSGNLDPYRLNKKIPYHSRIERALEYIEANFNQEFSITTLAALSGLSPYHFIRLFKVQTGLTPHSYLTRYRIDKAQKMLLRKDLSITEICFSSGFTNPSHFSAVFKQLTGMTPSEFRRVTVG